MGRADGQNAPSAKARNGPIGVGNLSQPGARQERDWFSYRSTCTGRKNSTTCPTWLCSVCRSLKGDFEPSLVFAHVVHRLQSFYPEVPYQFFVMLPYLIAVATLVIYARDADLPRALGRPFPD